MAKKKTASPQRSFQCRLNIEISYLIIMTTQQNLSEEEKNYPRFMAMTTLDVGLFVAEKVYPSLQFEYSLLHRAFSTARQKAEGRKQA